MGLVVHVKACEGMYHFFGHVVEQTFSVQPSHYMAYANITAQPADTTQGSTFFSFMLPYGAI
jgi:hypothetical protein